MMGLHRLRGIDARAVVAHFAGVASVVAGSWYLSTTGTRAFSHETVSQASFPPTALMYAAGGWLVRDGGPVVSDQSLWSRGADACLGAGVTQVVFAVAFDVLLWHRALPPASSQAVRSFWCQPHG